MRHLTLTIVLLASTVAGTSAAEDISQEDRNLQSQSRPLANGTMVIAWRGRQVPAPADLLIHFHGDPETVQSAFVRTKRTGVLVVINFPGLSSAYATPFENSSSLFREILDNARTVVTGSCAPDTGQSWEQVTLSSFSAGYGAVRHILTTPDSHLIDALVAADSIYAGLQEEAPRRLVNGEQMRGFLTFARKATRGQNAFLLTHSAQSTPYASTTETADYLLEALQIRRRLDSSGQIASLHQETSAGRGRFLVLGFEGTTGPDHLQHLHHIDQFWNEVERLCTHVPRDGQGPP